MESPQHKNREVQIEVNETESDHKRSQKSSQWFIHTSIARGGESRLESSPVKRGQQLMNPDPHQIHINRLSVDDRPDSIN